MQNSAISDTQITASTELEIKWGPKRARLHIKETSYYQGGWRPSTSDINQWLQIDLGTQKTKVTGVATQGGHSKVYKYWVQKYNLQYSETEDNFTYFEEQGQSLAKVWVRGSRYC